jgi:hypothetical protein
MAHGAYHIVFRAVYSLEHYRPLSLCGLVQDFPKPASQDLTCVLGCLLVGIFRLADRNRCLNKRLNAAEFLHGPLSLCLSPTRRTPADFL